MKKKILIDQTCFRKWGFALALTGSALLTSSAYAQMSQADYLNALKAAEQKVLRQKAAQGNAGALSSALVKRLFGRYYQKGDSWTVAAFYGEKSQARKVSDPELLQSNAGRVGIFHYEVVDVKPGAQPLVLIQVTQKEKQGVTVVDKKVEYLSLTFDDRLTQTQKAYKLKNRDDLIRVSAEGVHSNISLLELFPLDVPELLTAEHLAAQQLPEIPQALSRVAGGTFKPDLSKSSWFEQDDFFGRPIQVLWQHGDPWPAYYKTSNGVAVLIEKGTE